MDAKSWKIFIEHDFDSSDILQAALEDMQMMISSLCRLYLSTKYNLKIEITAKKSKATDLSVRLSLDDSPISLNNGTDEFDYVAELS